MVRAWLEMFRGLGNALFELILAEIAALRGEFAKSGKNIGIVLGLLGAAVVIAFWTFGVFTFALIQLVAIKLPVWGAALTVTGVLTLLMATLVAIAIFKLKSMESPMVVAHERVANLRSWWNHSLLPEDEKEVVEEELLEALEDAEEVL